MKVYQAWYQYDPTGHSFFGYESISGSLYSNREACEAEMQDWINPDNPEAPFYGEIIEMEIKDYYTPDVEQEEII